MKSHILFQTLYTSHLIIQLLHLCNNLLLIIILNTFFLKLFLKMYPMIDIFFLSPPIGENLSSLIPKAYSFSYESEELHKYLHDETFSFGKELIKC